MVSDGSVTCWLAELRAGNAAAAQPLWERYFGRLAGLARQKLQGVPRRAADEEDVALSALDTFCRGVGEGRFPQLLDRDGLWPLLVALTARKAVDLRRQETSRKRGGGLAEADLAALLSREPTPAFAAQVAEEFEKLLGLLEDEKMRAVALAKMEGYANEEIADRLGVALRTVERKLQRIRTLWTKGAES